jgi:hypothetical protein
MVTAGTPAARLSAWLLAGKLNRRTPEEVATSLATACLTRALAAACAFGSMVLIAWIAALARAVFRHGWSSTALNATSLARASIQAGHVEGDLVPVLGVWAALLLLTPTGYTIAFRCAAVAAGALGALDFSPPSFAVTPEAAGFARDLAQFTRSWNAALLLILTMTAAYLLHRGALGVFISLSEFSVRRTLRPARTVRFAVAFVVLLSAAWTGTVVWLAASQPGTASLGVRGGIVLSDYLVALGVVAVLVAGSAHAQGRLLASMPVAAVLGAVANVSPIPRDLMFSVERTGLERVGDAFGAGSWWAALFIGFPACLLGVYLMAPVRR